MGRKKKTSVFRIYFYFFIFWLDVFGKVIGKLHFFPGKLKYSI